jgi:hypothetical protein
MVLWPGHTQTFARKIMLYFNYFGISIRSAFEKVINIEKEVYENAKKTV